MMEKERQPNHTISTIKGTPYEIDEKYFVEIMKKLGEFLCKRYNHTDLVTPLEVMDQFKYINDLYLEQKLYLAFWLGKHSINDLEYETYILNCLDKE